jgi:hypothetical protein
VGMFLWLMSASGIAISSAPETEVLLTDVGTSSSFANVSALADDPPFLLRSSKSELSQLT